MPEKPLDVDKWQPILNMISYFVSLVDKSYNMTQPVAVVNRFLRIPQINERTAYRSIN
jgi:hypothetical protein